MEKLIVSAVIAARIDASDKEAFDKFCKSVGMNASTAINMFIKATLRANKIPFILAATLFTTKKTRHSSKKTFTKWKAM